MTLTHSTLLTSANLFRPYIALSRNLYFLRKISATKKTIRKSSIQLPLLMGLRAITRFSQLTDDFLFYPAALAAPPVSVPEYSFAPE